MLGTHSTYPKGGVSCSKDSFVVNQTLVFQIKFCGKNPALRVGAKRWLQLVELKESTGKPNALCSLMSFLDCHQG
ncbi:hypothetical protein [Emticicia sp.]|uniref:hypothetical protein n=1 Tax=Emticicia sp. TaxID=1930953 RepID=UPI003750AE9C